VSRLYNLSIRKKLLLFVFAAVTVPMVALFVSSTIIMDKQKKESELLYLQSALKIARTQMLMRKAEMEKGGQRLAQNPAFRIGVRAGNEKLLVEELIKLRQIYDYLDVAAVLNAERWPIARVSYDLRDDMPWDLDGLVQTVSEQGRSITSEEALPLGDLFFSNSASYERFKIPIANRWDSAGNQEYLTKCQIGLAVIPIFDEVRADQLIGYLVVGDAVNNDPYFPAFYSRQVENSFLAISTDGIRVSSNIQTPTKENYIGSRIPVTNKTLDGPKQYFFGRVDFNDEVHVFLDEPIINHKGEVTAALGVGIPEEKFAVILSTNQYLIVAVTILGLTVMLIIGRYFAGVITEPIMAATRFAEKLAQGERNLVLQPEWVENPHSETGILLTTFQKMAASLEASEKTNEEYLERLRQEHQKQVALSRQLQEMNDELEGKVVARTLELVQAVEALKKANGVKSQFLANMSHELRTPLSAIISSAEALIGRVFGPLTEKQEKHIQNALNNGNHLLQLINDILDICKIEAGKMNLTLNDFYIAEIIENSCAVARSIASRKNIELSVRMEPPDFKVRADAVKVKQILYNLLSNAVKFTPDNGKVEVEAFRQEHFAQFRIRDNGIGIRDEDQERVFVEFEQVDNSYQRLYEGTGLGLPLTKKLVEMHGGQIFLISKEGIGTEVVFTLPLPGGGDADSESIGKDENIG
jgi:signal transduction histidine kinase